MPNLFDTLGTATRGLRVTQRQMATTGHNIANVDTPGYSRQRGVLETAQPFKTDAGFIGTGVEQVSIERVFDRFTHSRLLAETARKHSLETESTIHRDVETIFNEQLVGGLREALTGLFDSLDDLASAAEPGQPIARSQVLASAESLVDTVRRYDEQLRALQRTADRGITDLLPDINALTQDLARLNLEITEAELVGPANDLRDRREETVRLLAEKLEITTFESAEGVFSVRTGSGLSLVDGTVSHELVAVVDPANPNGFDATFAQVHYAVSGSRVDATAQLRGGQLGGLIEARDGIIGGAIRDLDALVFTLVEEWNALHRNGLGLIDGAPHDFFADLSSQATADDAARNFALAADIDPGQGGSLGNIAAALAADPNGSGEGAPGDTDAIEALKDLRLARVTQYLAGDASGTRTGNPQSVLGQLGQIVGDLGQGAQTTSRALEQQDAVLSTIEDRRDAISGVSIDEEVAELVTLQATFQANARVVSVVSNLFGDLLDAI